MQQTDLVNQIVAKVMAALPAVQETSAVPASQAAKPPDPQIFSESNKSVPQAANGMLKLEQKIITGALIESHYKGQKELVVPPGSIITPSAHDILRKFKLSLQHVGHAAKTTGNTTSAKVAVNLLHQTETSLSLIDSLIKQLGFSKHQAGNHQEQLETIRSQICRGEFSRIVGFNKQPHKLACELNRNDQLRAMVICHREEWDLLAKDWQPNVICLSPEQQTFINLRQLMMSLLKI